MLQYLKSRSILHYASLMIGLGSALVGYACASTTVRHWGESGYAGSVFGIFLTAGFVFYAGFLVSFFLRKLPQVILAVASAGVLCWAITGVGYLIQRFLEGRREASLRATIIIIGLFYMALALAMARAHIVNKRRLPA